MRNKKAKILRRVIKNQINKMQVNSERDLMETKYEDVKKFARRVPYVDKGELKTADIVYTMPLRLDFCFRRAYQSLKQTVKRSGQLKNVRAR